MVRYAGYSTEQVVFCLDYTKISVFWNMADISASEEPAVAINLSHGSSVSIVTWAVLSL